MKKFFLIALLSLMAGSALAVPAYPKLISFKQPDRDITVSIYLKGDERVHWAETADGYSLLHSDDGSLVYATQNEKGDMIATDLIATEIEQRSTKVIDFLKDTPKHLHFSKAQVKEMLKIWEQVENAKSGPKTMSDVLGEKRFLVILFGFSDKSMTHTRMEFKNLFNQVNYTTEGRTGSVHDYYYDVSGGLFSLKVDVVGPYTGVHNTAHYGNSDYGYQDFAHEAVDSAAKDVDFSKYDNDNDGYIDGLHIIFAGHGEEAGGGVNCIWSHKWNIFDAPTYDNTVIDVYSCSPECGGASGSSITNIGVICHELGHVFGAPDYYDTDYESSGGEFPGLGQWDIMSSGSWNRGGITPAQHNPYTKIYIYHWATCDTIDSTPRTVVMSPVDYTNGDFHRVNTSTPGDFFLIENRQQIKWDKNTPGHGMLVYHVHPNAHGASVSNYKHPQQIYILAKTNPLDTFPTSIPSSYGDVNSNTAPFPGAIYSIRRDSLTDNSLPWFRPWSKQRNYIPFYHISENSTSKKVFFTVQDISPIPTDPTTEGIDQQSIAVRWTPFGGYNTMVVVNPDANIFGTPTGRHNAGDTIEGGGIVVYKGNQFNCIVPGLVSNRQYYFRLYTCINDTTYSDGVDVQGRTLNCDNSEWQTENFESAQFSELPDCWTGDWAVDSLLGQQALASNTVTGDAYTWSTVYSRPIVFDTTHNAVLHFKVHFDEMCNEQTILKIEYRSNAYADWETIDSTSWSFGMATWQDIHLQLLNAGINSRVRFSAYINSTQKVFIDDIEIDKGSLIYSSSDANGDIIPRGYSVLGENDTIEYIMTPLAGYKLRSLKRDGKNIAPSAIESLDNGSYRYLLAGVTGQHTLQATFERNADILTAEEQILTIFPNPTSGIVTVNTFAGNTIVIYNIMGKEILRRKAEAETLTINLKDLPNGIYLLRSENEVVKIIKK